MSSEAGLVRRTNDATARWGGALLLTGFLLRVAVGLWNSFVGPTVGANVDALAFHQQAAAIAAGAAPLWQIGWIYADFLGLVYRLTGPQMWVACALSSLAWLLSGLVLRSMLQRLATPEWAILAGMAVYCLLPSSVFTTGVALREAYQALFLGLAAYGLVDMFHGAAYRGTFLLIVGAGLGGLLHETFIPAGIVEALFAMGVLWWRARGPMRLVAALALFCAYSALQLQGFLHGSGSVDAMAAYHDILDSRTGATTYRTGAVDLHNVGNLLRWGIAGGLQYMFEPTPWRALRTGDYIVVAENLLRAVLAVAGLVSIWRSRGERRALLAMLFLLYCLTEALWSVGTSSWGTAIRHHVPSLGLLLACALAGLDRRQLEPAR